MVFGFDKESIIAEVKTSLAQELSKDLKFKRELQTLLGVYSNDTQDIKILCRDLLVRIDATQEQLTVLKNRLDNIEDEFMKLKAELFQKVKKK